MTRESPAQVFRGSPLSCEPRKAVAQRALDGETAACPESDQESDSRRHGHNRERVPTDDGALDLDLPPDQVAPRS